MNNLSDFLRDNLDKDQSEIDYSSLTPGEYARLRTLEVEVEDELKIKEEIEILLNNNFDLSFEEILGNLSENCLDGAALRRIYAEVFHVINTRALPKQSIYPKGSRIGDLIASLSEDFNDSEES